MRALALRAGVSQATPYNLFGSKRAVLVSVLEDIRDFGRFFAGAAALSPLERVLHAAALAVGYYERDPEFYRVVWKTLLGGDARDDRSAIFNPKRDAFWLQLLQDAADRREVTLCIGRLSAEQQQCVALAYYQGLSHSEVADHLAQPLGTVKSWLRRALLALKDCLSRAAGAGA